MTYATIYDFDGCVIADGVQSALKCDEAIQMARRIARERQRSVIVEDRGTRETYRMTPGGHCWKVPASWNDYATD